MCPVVLDDVVSRLAPRLAALWAPLRQSKRRAFDGQLLEARDVVLGHGERLPAVGADPGIHHVRQRWARAGSHAVPAGSAPVVGHQRRPAGAMTEA